MYCSECGNKVSDDESFCTNCGAPIDPLIESRKSLSNDSRHIGETQSIPDREKLDAANSENKSASPSPLRPNNHIEQVDNKGVNHSKIAIISAATGSVVALIAIICFAVFALPSVNNPDSHQDGSYDLEEKILGEHNDPQYDAIGESLSNPASAVEAQSVDSATSDADNSGFSGNRNSNAAKRDENGFLVVDFITASSTLKQDEINTSTYNASNVGDGDIETAWVEGASSSGNGESISFRVPFKEVFSGMKIRNGYQKSKYLYEVNARPSKISIYADNEFVKTVSIPDSGLVETDIDFGPVSAQEIELVIESVYEGSKYDDCAISEVKFY